MLLSHDDAAQFIRLIRRLQFYVNRQQLLFPEASSWEDFGRLENKQLVQVRNALWEHAELIDAYRQSNPDNLSENELSIIGKWKGFVVDKYYIFRYLKEHAIFIGNKQIYGVKALTTPFPDVFYGRPLPILIDAVLLPFKGQIVYDGFSNSYNIVFGAGIRGDMQEKYLHAKQNGLIITSLEGEHKPKPLPSPQKLLAPGSIEAASEIVKSCGKLRGGTAVQGAAFGVLRNSAILAEVAALQPKDDREIQRLARKVSNALRRLERVLDREMWA
ncbi:hypothetical protein HY768_03475 [candidate division TA06 bacterium]|uniref:Uncharacterized protein n=1 Tax=candidate division TA06 bacterium TaxID=2250710 RepID=A0A933IBI2_UNCT6|nr:hypothetical protein [candidate division TA06 bacterium]